MRRERKEKRKEEDEGSKYIEAGHVTRPLTVGLFERAYDAESFGEEQQDRCIKGLKAAVQHLHDLGLAHINLTPLNVMFPEDGDPVLLHLDTCHPIGTKLRKRGKVGDLENGVPIAKYE